MNRALILVFSFVCSGATLGFECPKTGNSEDIALHWPLATDVVGGVIIEGSFDSSKPINEQVHLGFQVERSFKGSKEGKIDLVSDPYSELMIGKSYILFLYGSNALMFCSKYIHLWAPEFTDEYLYHTSKRLDLDYAKDLRFIVQKLGIKP